MGFAGETLSKYEMGFAGETLFTVEAFSKVGEPFEARGVPAVSF